MSLSPAVRQIFAGLSGDDLARLTDTELLARFTANRDESAFAVLVERHAPAVLGVCRRMLGHAQDAEDAAQAVFLVLARNARRVRKPAALSAWLHGVAVRVSRKALARRRKAEPLPGALPAAEPPDGATWADARRVIDEALATLSESLRLPVVLCYLEGLTRDEAAARLGWSLDTFRGRLERGREKLRAVLARRGFPLAAGLLAVLLESPASAAPGWVGATAALASGSASAPPAVASLSTGVLPVRAFTICALVVACAGGLAAGLYVMQKQPEKPPVAPPPILEKLLVPDPKAPAVSKELAGVWRSSRTEDGATRTETLRFVDGKHLVWQMHLRSPGVDTSVTIRGAYVLKDGELTIDALAKWNGEEPMAVRPDDAGRKYKLAWSEDRSGFNLSDVKAAADSPWAVREFRPVKDERAEPPAVPKALQKVERAIRKEPKYAGEPRYLLLAFGPEAKFLVWVVLDGTTLYVDRNGNGDLTDDGEKFTDGAVKHEKGKVRSVMYFGIELTEPNGTKHPNLMMSAVNMESGGTYAKFGVRVNGKTDQTAGLTNLRLAESAKDAQVAHFGGTEITVRPSLSMPGYPDANARADFRVQVGTPGIGSGSFVSFLSELTAEGIGPVAEFEFTPVKAGEPTRKITLHLTERCCGDQFFAKVAVPDDVTTGVNAAKVTLSFPDCPWGKVEPATHTVDVMPKRKE
jgi:RNA polymerase sigma factor (sigma-70 family)